MADTAGTSETASWIQAGGVALFATAVLWELKKLGPLIKEWSKAMGEIKEVLASLLERERMRAEQREKLIEYQSQQRPRARSPQPPRDEYWDEDATDNVSLPVEQQERPRVKSNPQGVPTGQYGPMRPKKQER